MKKIAYRALLAVNILFAASLLISYLAVHISPDKFALPAFFGLAYPYLLLANILLALAWAVLLKFEALISVVVIALGITHLTNYLKISRSTGKKEGTFKVMSYNLRLFNNFESQTTSSEKKVLAFLKVQKPDILCLQEFYVNGDPVMKDSSVKSALGGGYYSHMKMIGNGKNRYYGIATYSKYPIVGKGEIIHTGSSSLSIYTDIVIKKDTFRVFNNHLQSFRLRSIEKSFLEEMTTPDDKETFDEVKNLSVSLKKGFVRRARQAQAVKARVNSSPYPVIVAGDFNDTPVSYSYRKIRKGLNDSFVSSGYGAGFTYRGNYPPNRIDYILYD
ncbi:MAG TPA: endonuclease/exonuclease/phosphatase family protein, partial [Bacteroidales bacterium]|nr:endonuclease/exonuclease/phosphatase family protein [Bacteroidales bacterium]